MLTRTKSVGPSSTFCSIINFSAYNNVNKMQQLVMFLLLVVTESVRIWKAIRFVGFLYFPSCFIFFISQFIRILFLGRTIVWLLPLRHVRIGDDSLRHWLSEEELKGWRTHIWLTWMIKGVSEPKTTKRKMCLQEFR